MFYYSHHPPSVLVFQGTREFQGLQVFPKDEKKKKYRYKVVCHQAPYLICNIYKGKRYQFLFTLNLSIDGWKALNDILMQMKPSALLN